MKKVAVFLSVLFTLISSILLPFSISAEISGFDYDNYYLLDYIESDGTNYIQSDMPSDYGIFDYKVKFSSVHTSATQIVFIGSRPQSGVQRAVLIAKSSMLGYGFASTWKNVHTYQADTDYTCETVFIAGSGTQAEFTCNGTTYYQNFPTDTSVGYNVMQDIFGNNQNGSHVVATEPMRLYYLYRKDITGVYTHRYVPAMRKADNVVGLYDCENNVFKTKSAGSNFSYGGVIPTQYTITTSVSPSGSGSVIGGGTYDSGDIITLTATANTGYSFVRWSDNVYDNPRTVTVNSSQSYTAIFQQQSIPVTQYTITTSVTPVDSGVVTGGGTYDENTVINLVATPNNGFVFSQWSDGVTNASRSVTVTGDMSFTAQFSSYTPPTQTYTVNVQASPSAGGSVSGGGTYEINQTATLTAVPASGYVFSAWSDGYTQNPRQLQVTSNINLTAYFTQDISNTQILGCNIFVSDFERSNVYSYYGSQSGNLIYIYPAEYEGTAPLGGTSVDSNPSYVYTIDFVFNDDYYGSFGFTLRTAGGIRIEGRTLYVNGNHCSYSFLYEGIYDLQAGTIEFYNTNNLIKKKSVVSGIFDGTSDSIQSEQILDQSNEDLTDTVNQFDSIESGFNDDMNDALENIDVSVNPGTFGSKFQSSAIWVSQQFNTLTSNTPYGSILGFSLVLGVSLLIIGKVLG